ncbi:DUF960 family protein [Ornithinibacillus sp. JPR2-1]|uniref:DUF960 family protein n=1 Tax=Ornithinibacillus sp. JPR2-1 TaxID=2094019 RepID=UPI0031D4ACD6
MFDTTKSYYITKGVKTNICADMVKGMLDSIMEMKKVTQLDYLQVFDISLSTNGKTTYINHSQEEPKYNKQLMFTGGVNQFTGKVFIIDDGSCVTTMLAEEY